MNNLLLYKLIILYMPIFVFHRNESILPMNIEGYINKCDIYPLLNNNYILSSELIHNLTHTVITSEETSKYTLRLKDEYRSYYHNQPTISNINISRYLENIPVYVKTQITSNYLYIIYILFYPYNPPITIAGFDIGAHDSDIEHITIKININDHQITSIYYSAHTNSEGLWATSKQITKIGSRPVIYIAKGSHGMYNKKGYYYRFGGFGNDITGSFHYWKPNIRKIIRLNHIYIPHIHGFINFLGHYGNWSIGSIPRRNWWTDPETEKDDDFPYYNQYVNLRFDVLILGLICYIIFKYYRLSRYKYYRVIKNV